MTADDLKLVPTDDMIVELMNRHEHAAFVGMKTGTPGPEDILTTRKWKGNSATVQGMISQLDYAINTVVDADATRITEAP